MLIFTPKSNRQCLSRLSYTSCIRPSLFQNHSLSLVYRKTPMHAIQHIHRTTNITSYQPVVMLSKYRGYVQKVYANTFVGHHSKPDMITVQLQSLFKNSSIAKKMYPLYKNIWQDILLEEQHYYRSRPTQSLGLLAPLLSHRQTFGVLTKFYLGKMNKEEIMRYASLYPSPFYTWRILQGLSNQDTFMQPLKQFTMMAKEQNQVSMQYVYPKKKETKNEVENKQVIENELSSVGKQTLQQNVNTNSTNTNDPTSSISLQNMQQIITQVTKELEKQYRYETKRYGRGF